MKFWKIVLLKRNTEKVFLFKIWAKNILMKSSNIIYWNCFFYYPGAKAMYFIICLRFSYRFLESVQCCLWNNEVRIKVRDKFIDWIKFLPAISVIISLHYWIYFEILQTDSFRCYFVMQVLFTRTPCMCILSSITDSGMSL
jgi:hypothetical protein